MTANSKEQNCQLSANSLSAKREIFGLAGVEGLRTPNPRFWRPVL